MNLSMTKFFMNHSGLRNFENLDFFDRSENGPLLLFTTPHSSQLQFSRTLRWSEENLIASWNHERGWYSMKFTTHFRLNKKSYYVEDRQNRLEQESANQRSANQIQLATCFVNNVFFKQIRSHSFVYCCFPAMMAMPSSRYILWSADPKISGPLQKKFADF